MESNQDVDRDAVRNGNNPDDNHRGKSFGGKMTLVEEIEARRVAKKNDRKKRTELSKARKIRGNKPSPSFTI